ncbi:MAG: hypothetical protein A2Y38_10265 [Spirochaetes bacterium GWB1_59_5]|nr:MAG: hypothetical protein A2Y38_10265 [Spirochaetes bacterium GWB1_59_5]
MELKPEFKNLRVKIGQIWTSLDKRRPYREMEVSDIGDGYVQFTYKRGDEIAVTDIRLDTLLYKYTLTRRADHTRGRGYKLLKDVPDADIEKPSEDLNVGVPGAGAAPDAGGVHQEDGDPKLGDHSSELGEDAASDEQIAESDDGVRADS